MRHLDNKKKKMKYLSIRSEWESIYSGFCVRINLYCSAIIFYFLIVVTILSNFLQALTCRFFLSYKIATQKWYICCGGAHKGYIIYIFLVCRRLYIRALWENCLALDKSVGGSRSSGTVVQLQNSRVHAAKADSSCCSVAASSIWCLQGQLWWC